MTLRQKQSDFLVKVSKLIAFACLQNISVFVNEWYRTKERQAELVAQGKSWTMNSKHIDGLAVDLVVIKDDGSVSWDCKDYELLGAYWTAHLDGVWGGRFKQRDCVHFQYD